MSRSARLLSLIQALRRRRTPVTAADLAHELGVSPRTVYRDIATLGGEGVPVVGAAGFGYVLEAGTFLPPLMLDEDEVDAIVLGLRFVAQRGGPDLAAAAGNALGKIAAVLPPDRGDEAPAVALLAGPGLTHGATDHVAVLRRAMRVEEALWLDYRDKDDRASRRTVWPVALGFFAKVEVLAAWCEARADFRHFRLDRIVAVAPTGCRMPKRRRVLMAEWRRAQGLRNLP